MVAGKFKSRTYIRKRIKTPGGKNIMQHKLRKPQPAHCSSCGIILAGVARARPAGLRKLSKTQKVPSRAFAGQLCSPCSRRAIIIKARQ